MAQEISQNAICYSIGWDTNYITDKFKKVILVKVKGHSGDKYNEMCDKLARKAINK